MIYFSSDTHYFHIKIIEYCRRPFANVEEMNEVMIENWNKTVSANDIIYHLGDVIFHPDMQQVDAILSRLNGHKYLIAGNHDSKIRTKPQFQKHWGFIKDYEELKYKDTKFVLCHYPMLTWNGARRGSIMLAGHTHSTIHNLNTECRRFDIGVDCYNFTPVSIDQIIEESNNKSIVDVRDYD